MSDKINRLIQEANIDKERAARLLEEMAVMETQITELRAALSDERKRALEEAAKWHDAKVAELDERIAENNAYSLRNGHNATGGANEYCRDLQTAHRLSAAAIRALKEKP